MTRQGRRLAVRYDAAIIGAGTNGLAAASVLAGAGLKTIVIERAQVCGGRATTRKFHPGFRASPYCDEIAAIPPEIFRALDLARHGAIFVPSPSSLALWPDRQHQVLNWSPDTIWNRLRDAARVRTSDVLTRAFEDASRVERNYWWHTASDAEPWPGEEWSHRSLADMLTESLSIEDAQAHFLAEALSGRSADLFLNGSALHLLAPANGTFAGGLATLAGALTAAARSAGAEISLGLEASDIRLKGDRVAAVRLADGTEIEARAVISTLDMRRTFFSLFAWKDLPQAVVQRASAFRHAGGTARLLIALDAPPSLGADFVSGPVHVAPGIETFAKAHATCAAATIPDFPPLTLRLVSVADPRLAPVGKAVLTATIGCIPHRLFDGPWTNEKRAALRKQVLAQIESVLPGTTEHVVDADLILPPDIEDVLGVTEGDLDGGEIAPDQMFGFRGFVNCPGGRTPIKGLYLGGRSSPAGLSGTCAAGVMAARAVAADLNAGRLK
jgi:phytoene dehydrogenase-like protein